VHADAVAGLPLPRSRKTAEPERSVNSALFCSALVLFHRSILRFIDESIFDRFNVQQKLTKATQRNER